MTHYHIYQITEETIPGCPFEFVLMPTFYYVRSTAQAHAKDTGMVRKCRAEDRACYAVIEKLDEGLTELMDRDDHQH